MKHLLFIACIFFGIGAHSQTMKKDTRLDIIKADDTDEYQLSQISKADLLRALDKLGSRIFICNTTPQFSKTYKLKIELEEFVNGKLLSTRNVSPIDNNKYIYWVKDKSYTDYINKITFTTREVDTACTLFINIAGNSTGGRMKKHIERTSQSYEWRRYSVTNWKLNTKIPLLIYASSWYDKADNVDRFCGASDLSYDKAATKELLDKSPHYYLVSYTISE